MKITVNDIGRKAKVSPDSPVLPNEIVTIREEYYKIGIIIEATQGSYLITEKFLTLLPETEPFTFQLGDIVSFGGVEGTVTEDTGLLHPIIISFKNNSRWAFTRDGRYSISHTEPLLKFISRPKKKVKKEVNVKVWYSPSLDIMTQLSQDGTMPGDSQLIELKGEIEVDE